MALREVIRAHSVVLALLLVLAVYHVSLQDRGAFSWPDEHLYGDALRAAQALGRLDVAGFGRELTGFGARPAEATVRLIPATLQLLLERVTGVAPVNPESLRIGTAWNVLVVFALGICVYRLSLIFFDGHRAFATLAAGIYALLPSSSVYVRHLMPYDGALLLGLLALWRALTIGGHAGALAPRRAILALLSAGGAVVVYPATFLWFRSWAVAGAVLAFALVVVAAATLATGASQPATRRAVAAGVLAGFGLAMYPAYFPLPAAVIGVILLGGGDAALDGLLHVRLRVHAAVVYAASLGCVLYAYEVVARLGNVSYLASAYRLSKTITNGGSFEEGYVFLVKYLAGADGAIGLLVAGLAAIYLILALGRATRGVRCPGGEAALARCVVLLTLAYLVYASQSVFLHTMTFTGRYVHFYIPFVVWAAVAVLRELRPARVRACAAVAVAAVSVSSFAAFAVEYRHVAYPLNVLHHHGIRWEDVAAQNKIDEATVMPGWTFTLPGKGLSGETSYTTSRGDQRYVLVNFGLFHPFFDGVTPYTPPPAAEVVYRQPHFQAFRGYRFEAYPIEQRRAFETRRFDVAIYRIPEPRAAAAAGR